MSPLCPRCNEKIETLEHVFVTCSKITRTWFGSQLNLKILDHQITNLTDWIVFCILNHNEEILIHLASILYYIWFARNLSLFEDKILPEEVIIERAAHSILDFRNANNLLLSENLYPPPFNQAPNHQQHPHWSKPPENMLKANCDANLQTQGHWGLGAIVRNDSGLVMAAATWSLDGSDDPLMTEAFALLTTMRLAIDCGFRKIIFEGDNERVILMARNGKLHNKTYLGSIIEEIQSLQRAFDICNFNFSHKSSNKVTHKLAQMAHSEQNHVWLEEVPNTILDVYFHDLVH